MCEIGGILNAQSSLSQIVKKNKNKGFTIPFNFHSRWNYPPPKERDEKGRKGWYWRGTFIRDEEWRLILLSGMGGNVRHTALPSISDLAPMPSPQRERQSNGNRKCPGWFPACDPHLQDFLRTEQQSLLFNGGGKQRIQQRWKRDGLKSIVW